MNTMQSLQRQWDAEARTIEAGTRAFFPDKPAGEPSMLAGVSAVLTVFLLLAAVGVCLP